MGTAIMELKLTQKLVKVDLNPLFLVLLDLRKECDTVDRELLIQNLEGYGAGPRLFGILETFSAHQKVVPRQNGYHGLSFPSTRGTAQGVLV